jgi:hypothetical protein
MGDRSGKGGKGQGVWAKCPSSFSKPNREGSRQGGWPVEGEGAPATQAMGTAGRWGKTELRSRATHSAPHLGRGRTVEGDRQRRAVCNRDGTGGGSWRLGRERGRTVRLGGEAGAARVRFIGVVRRFEAIF